MKKFISIIGIILIFIVIYILQANFFTWFNIADIKPNMFVILILLIGLFVGKEYGFLIGLISGILIDFFIGKSIGTTGIMLSIIGLLGGYLDKNFSKESRVTIMLMVAGSTAIFETGIYLFKILKYGIPIEIITFLKVLIIEIIFNILLVIIFYPLIQKTGQHLENQFKQKKIVTRYF